jgi:hypothetical protein
MFYSSMAMVGTLKASNESEKIKTPSNILCVFSSKVLLTSSKRVVQLQVLYNLLPLPSPTHSSFVNPFKSSLLTIHSHYSPPSISLLRQSWNFQLQIFSLMWKLNIMAFALMLGVWQGVAITTL